MYFHRLGPDSIPGEFLLAWTMVVFAAFIEDFWFLKVLVVVFTLFIIFVTTSGLEKVLSWRWVRRFVIDKEALFN